MVNFKPLLNEASCADIAQVLNTCLVKEWSNMKLIESLSDSFSFDDEEKTKDILLESLTKFWSLKCNSDKNTAKAVTKATHLAKKTSEVIYSRPVRMIIMSNIADQRRHVQKHLRTCVRDGILNQGYEDAEISLTNAVDRTEVPEEHELPEVQESHEEPELHEVHELPEEYELPEEHELPKQKKRKFLQKEEFKALSRTEQLKKLTEFYGTGNFLDLTKKASIPKKLAKEIKALKNFYSLDLPYLLKKEEHDLLKKIAQCRNKEGLYAVVKDVDPFTRNSALPFIKQAVQKLCYLYNDNLLENPNNNEDWYRIMVYSDLFDYIFASKEGFIIKRSECHSKIIKSLKELGLIKEDESNVKLDFIFYSTSITGINDALICEDKPTENESTKDIKKTRKLREKSLLYWRSILHCSNSLDHLLSTSCRFNKLNLLITSTKIIENITVHTTLKEISIPASERSGGAIADFISVVISLMRTVVRNIDVVETILQVIHEDNLNFMAPDDSFLFASDPESTNSTSSGENWQAAEREERIKEKVNEAIDALNDQYQSQYVSSDWEINAFYDDN